MPAARKYKKKMSSKKRRYSSKKKSYGPLSRTLGTGIPARTRTTLKYVQNVSLNSVAGAMGTQIFRATGPYDPDYAVGGHQPMYWDQMAALYNHYIVHKSKIYVQFCPYDQVASSSSVVFLRGDDSASLTSTNMYTNLETKGTKHQIVPIYGENQVFKGSLSTSYFKNKTFKNFKNSDLQSAVTTTPTEEYYFILGIKTDDGSTTTSMHCWVTIYYDVEFFELKDINSS